MGIYWCTINVFPCSFFSIPTPETMGFSWGWNHIGTVDRSTSTDGIQWNTKILWISQLPFCSAHFGAESGAPPEARPKTLGYVSEAWSGCVHFFSWRFHPFFWVFRALTWTFSYIFSTSTGWFSRAVPRAQVLPSRRVAFAALCNQKS